VGLFCGPHAAIPILPTISNFFNGIPGDLAQWAVGLEKWAVATLLKLLQDAQPPDFSSNPVLLLQRDTIWFAGFAGVLGLLIAAGRIALQRKASTARFAVRGLLHIALTSTILVTAVTLADKLGTDYARWIISQALASGNGHGQVANLAKLGKSIVKIGQYNPLLGLQAGETVTALITGFIATITFSGGIIQIFLFLVRNAVVDILIALLPVSAGMSTTEVGMAVYRKHQVWLLAWVLYLPVGATIIAFGYMLLMSPSSSDQLVGAAMFPISWVALPATMRLVMPLVSQATTQDGGSFAPAVRVASTAAVGGVGLATGAPTGAVTAFGSGAFGSSKKQPGP
jgi:hypothetical protein